MKILKKMAIYIVIAITVIGLSGCASNMVNTIPNMDMSKKIINEEKSYITFSRPAFIGAALTNTIIRFDPVSKDTELVGILGSNNKVIYTLDPGTHYFFMDGGENDDMIKVSVDKNKMYYIETEVGIGIMVGRFYFKPYKYSIENKLANLKGSKCEKEFLEINGFSRTYEEEQFPGVAKDKYESDILKVSIECSNGEVIKVSRDGGYLIDDLIKQDQVEANQKGFEYYKKNLPGYLSEIEEDFPDWIKEEYLENELKKEDGFHIKL